MTIEEVLAEVDAEKPNQYDDRTKIKWISELEGKIFKEMVLTHVNDIEDTTFNGYTEDDMDVELIAEYPYAEVYKYYVFAMIDFTNGETDRYTNSMIMFNNSMQDYKNWYNRNHMPLYKPLRLF